MPFAKKRLRQSMPDPDGAHAVTSPAAHCSGGVMDSSESLYLADISRALYQPQRMAAKQGALG